MAEAVDLVECRCADCGARYRVAPRANARQAACRKCGGVVSVPATGCSAALPSTPDKHRRKPQPASILFGDFTRHCRELTQMLYRMRFGGVNTGELRPA
jgi:hypothetical protein